MSEFIVNYKLDSDNSTVLDEGIVTIYEKKSDGYIRFEGKETEIEVPIKSDSFDFFRGQKNQILMKGTSGEKVTIIFDESSGSAFAHFEKLIIKHRYTNHEETTYPSGNIRFAGPHINGKPHGKHVEEFHDFPIRKTKFFGEFEEGQYDGGIFYSANGLVSVQCDNICNGKLYDEGTISFGGNVVATVDFSNVNLKTNLNEPNICYSIAEQCISNFNNKIFYEYMDDLPMNLQMKIMKNRIIRLENLIDELTDKKKNNWW